MFLLLGVLTLPLGCVSKAEQRCLHGPCLPMCFASMLSHPNHVHASTRRMGTVEWDQLSLLPASC